MAYAKTVVDHVFKPVLERNLEILNAHLSKRGLRAGIEITWYFDKSEG